MSQYSPDLLEKFIIQHSNKHLSNDIQMAVNDIQITENALQEKMICNLQIDTYNKMESACY